MLKLFVYDHCPYCVKARLIFGFKELSFELVTLANDDEATPISMIGQKMVPILQKMDGSYMPESMDIVHYVDKEFDGKILEGETRPEIQQWINAAGAYLYKLAMPRWVMAPLEEFATDKAKAYFTRKKEAYIGSFETHIANSSFYIEQINRHLLILDPLIRASQGVNGMLSEDDIHLFATLRSLSIVKGIHYPPQVEAYRQSLSFLGGVPLHDAIAL